MTAEVVVARELTHFNPADAETIETIAARVIPGDESDPGAREADVITYIDRTLAGFDHYTQPLYARGLKLLDELSRKSQGEPFVKLTPEDQDAILAQIEDEGESASPGSHENVLADFFALVRQHTIEGMFADPMYGGNRDGVGWKLVGFPGAQWGYSTEQKQRGFDASTMDPISLNELRRQYGNNPDRPAPNPKE